MPLDLSVMVDESGSEDSRYYLVTLVFHDQAEDISTPISIYEASLRERGLDDVPFHASPLMNGHDDYKNLGIETRKRMFSAFFMMFQHMPVRYHTFFYVKREVGGADALTARMRRDIVNLIFDQLAYFQSYDSVKVYYDGGQGVVTKATSTPITPCTTVRAIRHCHSLEPRNSPGSSAPRTCTPMSTSTPSGMPSVSSTRPSWHRKRPWYSRLHDLCQPPKTTAQESELPQVRRLSPSTYRSKQ